MVFLFVTAGNNMHSKYSKHCDDQIIFSLNLNIKQISYYLLVD